MDMIVLAPAALCGACRTLWRLPLTAACCLFRFKYDSAGEDQRLMAGRCLGELVRKMGDRVLGQIIPILRVTMDHPAFGCMCGLGIERRCC